MKNKEGDKEDGKEDDRQAKMKRPGSLTFCRAKTLLPHTHKETRRKRPNLTFVPDGLTFHPCAAFLFCYTPDLEKGSGFRIFFLLRFLSPRQLYPARRFFIPGQSIRLTGA
ncbi:MAG: hypothetical protein ACKV2V_17140 [Blastocatellia bacterium]